MTAVSYNGEKRNTIAMQLASTPETGVVGCMCLGLSSLVLNSCHAFSTTGESI